MLIFFVDFFDMGNVTISPTEMDRRVGKPGTGQVELFSAVFSMLASSLIHHWFTTRFSYFYCYGGSVALFLIEYLSMCLPPLLIHTFFGNNVLLTTILMLTICFVLCNSTRELRALRTSVCHDFKVATLVGTCVVIAAVDCKRIFTPQFVKTRMFGFSPMDLGTGLFVAIKGLDTLRRDLRHANVFQSEHPTTIPNQLYNRANNRSESRKQAPSQLRNVDVPQRFNIPRFLPLLVIGLARAVFIEFTGYYQDPIEYGTHWNFFITLAVIELFISAVHAISNNDLIVPVVSVIVGLAYFAFLSLFNYEEYILGMDTQRSGFFDGNREGIFSTFGYLFIFGLSYLVGRFFVPLALWDGFSTNQGEHPNMLFPLVRNCVVQVLLYAFALYRIGLPSRRTANLVYGLHIHCVVTIIVLFIHIYQHRIGTRMITASLTTQLPTLHSAIVRQGAFFFLAANLFTGLLNYGRDYIQTPSMEFGSQVVYMLILCLSTKLLDKLTAKNVERRLFNKP